MKNLPAITPVPAIVTPKPITGEIVDPNDFPFYARTYDVLSQAAENLAHTSEIFRLLSSIYTKPHPAVTIDHFVKVLRGEHECYRLKVFMDSVLSSRPMP